MHNIEEITSCTDLAGKRVLLRVDFNVPIHEGEITDPFRIDTAIETINYVRSKGARIILVSHIGRDPTETLAPVYTYLRDEKKLPITFQKTVAIDAIAGAVEAMDSGDILLLENIRQQPGEVDNDTKFAQALASCADVYVNEAFAVSHRAHASIVGVPQLLPAYAGIRLMQEIDTLTQARQTPAHPFVFILGGAKFETKLPLIKKFLHIADTVFVAGALMNEFFEAQGYTVGRSVTTERDYDLEELLSHPALHIPEYVLIEAADGSVSEKHCRDVSETDMIVDIGPSVIAPLAKRIQRANTILWNGPTGFYEHGYTHATKEILRLLKRSDAQTIVGGGDTVTLISQENAFAGISFVSTGGGALLTFLSEGSLPGIDALAKG